jgi:hypothetical protein
MYICLDTRLRFSVPCCGTEVSLLVSRGIHFVNFGSQTVSALYNCCSTCSATRFATRLWTPIHGCG